jgi:hypothetical protein
VCLIYTQVIVPSDAAAQSVKDIGGWVGRFWRFGEQMSQHTPRAQASPALTEGIQARAFVHFNAQLKTSIIFQSINRVFLIEDPFIWQGDQTTTVNYSAGLTPHFA